MITNKTKTETSSTHIDNSLNLEHNKNLITTEWLENAIPLDAALIKSAPELSDIANLLLPLLENAIQDEGKIKNTESANGKARIRYTCKAVLFNLYVAYLMNAPIRYSRTKSSFGKARRYGQLFFKYDRLMAVLAAFKSHGLIYQKAGRYDRIKGIKRQARIWATDKLEDMFRDATRGVPRQIFAEDKADPVVLKNAAKKEIDYLDSIATNEIRSNLTKYNDFISNQHISILSTGEQEISLYNLYNKIFYNLLKGSGWIQVISATRLPIKASKGVSPPNTFLGVKFNNRMLLSISASVRVAMSNFFGQKRLILPLVFSLVPRCQLA